jgi:hypothetical protein
VSNLHRMLLCAVLAVFVAALPAVWEGTATAVEAAQIPGTTCSVLPANNVWNADISKLPVNSHSAAWLGSTGAFAGRKLHPDFGGPPYGIPFNVVSSSHATTNFNFLYWDESDPVVATQQPQGPYPYGSDLAIEAGSDSHLLTIDKDKCTLYETGGTDSDGPSTAWSGAIFDLNSNALRPNTWTSADAARLPIFPGLVRLDEVQAGSIKHAIRFTVQQSDRSYLWPARHQAGSAYNSDLPPMGARFRLKASYNISGFNVQTQVVLTAMKHYGLIVADNGSNWFSQGTMDSGWNSEPYATMIAQLKTIPAAAFEAVDESALIVAENSGQTATPCSGVTISPLPGSYAVTSTLSFVASASGCPKPEYEYWIRPAGGIWKIVRYYAYSGSYAWHTTGLLPRMYEVAVRAREHGLGNPTFDTAAGGISTP